MPLNALKPFIFLSVPVADDPRGHYKICMTHLPGSTVVLQVLPSLVTGGVEKGTVEITAAIVKAGGIALVASAGGRMVRDIEAAGGHHITLPLDSKNPITLMLNALRLRNVAISKNVSIIHARSRAPAWSAWLAMQCTGAVFMTTYHGTYSARSALKRFYNSIMARGSIVIAASRFIAERIVREHGIPADRIALIPRGVDLAAFNPDAIVSDRIEKLLHSWGVTQERRLILMPGRLTAWKGQTILLEAIAKLSDPTVCCVFVGSDQGRTAYSDALRKRASELGLADRAFFVGDCSDMPAAFMTADVVVHASVQPEAFGRVVIEAQAMARAVIASEIGGPAETVRHGETGFLVRAGDPTALSDAIAMVLAMDRADLLALGIRARRAVPTVQAMQDATLNVYRKALTDAGRFPENSP